MKIYFFGSDTCENCTLMIDQINNKKNFPEYIDNTRIEVVYVDAFAKENEKFCDLNNIDQLPHIKVVDKDQVIFEKVGYIHPKKMFLAIIKHIKSE